MGSNNADESIDHKLPSWNGEWTRWSDYQLRVGLKADGTKEEDLVLLAPRLAANLTGRAFDAIAEIDREKLKKKDGFKYLLEYLEKSRGKEKVDILGDAFQEFFVKRDCYRKDGEEMADYEPRFRALIRRLEKAVAEAGAGNKIPSEIFGWYLLNCYMRMEPSDVANVRGKAESYKLADVLAALQKMWSGGGLGQKDSERKKRKDPVVNHTLHVADGSSEVSEKGMEEGDEAEDDGQTETDDTETWCQDALNAFLDDPNDPDILANFKEARRALDAARTSRGFYPVKNPNGFRKGYSKGQNSGKGWGKGNYDHSDKICIRCGKRGHIARNCPQKPSSSGDTNNRIGFVGFAERNGEEEACEKGNEMNFGQVWNTHDAAHFMNGCAVLDCGASDNVIGINTLQSLTDLYEDLGFDVRAEFDVDRRIHKKFIYGSDHSSSSLGLVQFQAGILGKEVKISAHVVEGSTPLLLSSQFLYEYKVAINFRSGAAVFREISNDQVQLERAAGGHLVLPVVAFAGNHAVLERLRVDGQDEVTADLSEKIAFVEPTTSERGDSES